MLVLVSCGSGSGSSDQPTDAVTAPADSSAVVSADSTEAQAPAEEAKETVEQVK